MEIKKVKLLNLSITKLYGELNYSVTFNDDITFLYGDNGCGKTTILNILTYIITGKIYELFRYDFTTMELTYSSAQTGKKEKIKLLNDRVNNISVSYQDNVTLIESRKFELSRNPEEAEEAEHFYFSEYPVLKHIKETFNYLYLPLNRNGNIHFDFPYNQRNRGIVHSRYFRGRNDEITLLGVESLISSAYSKRNFSLNNLNEQFSDDVLKSFLDVNNIPDPEEIVQYLVRLNETEIRQTQSDYIKVLKTLGKWDNEIIEKVNLFFDSLFDYAEQAKKEDSPSFDLASLFKISEILKIKKVIEKAEKIENSKKRAMKPVEDFLNTVNRFIDTPNNNKIINIERDGTVVLKTSTNKKISIYDLSSGEKQIITFFAYLVFGLPNTNQSIFIVDEPELSLHLNWQRKFVDSILSINKNVQLIFATHSPEMIGKHRNKAVKLLPKNQDGVKNE